MSKGLSRLALCLLLLSFVVPHARAVATGDFNNDTRVQVDDAVLILQTAVGLLPAPAEEIARADLTGDAKLDVSDAIWVLQIAVGLRPPVVVPNPVSVTVKTDDARAASALIPVTGGTLTATGADGTKFTLTIPDKALLSEERITLTPVQSIEGMPFAGGMVAAARMEPEGLQLLRFATLTIEPPALPPPGEQVGFASHELGEEFHLYPMQKDAKPTFKLLHFSEAGLARGTEAEQAAQQQRTPSTAEDRLAQKAREIIAKERVSELLGQEGDPQFAEKMEGLFHDYYREVVRPLLVAAGTDDSLARCAVQKYLSWVRQLQLLGFSTEESGFTPATGTSDFSAEINDAVPLLQQVMKNAVEKTAERCIQGHDLSQAVKLLSLARTAELLGGALFGGYTTEQLLELMDRCLRFEVEFESRIQSVSEIGGTITLHVRARVPLHFDFLKGLVGEGPLEYVEATVTGHPCQWRLVGRGSVARVLTGSLNLNLRQTPETDCTNPNRKPEPSPKNPDPGAVIQFDPGLPVEDFTMTCPDAPDANASGEFEQWTSFFQHFHDPEAHPAGGYVFRQWESGGTTGALLARKTYQNTWSGSGTTNTETTALNLWHRPG